MKRPQPSREAAFFFGSVVGVLVAGKPWKSVGYSGLAVTPGRRGDAIGGRRSGGLGRFWALYLGTRSESLSGRDPLVDGLRLFVLHGALTCPAIAVAVPRGQDADDDETAETLGGAIATRFEAHELTVEGPCGTSRVRFKVPTVWARMPQCVLARFAPRSTRWSFQSDDPSANTPRMSKSR